MGLPAKQRPKSRKRRIQYHYQLKKINLSFCSKCKKPILSHHLCLFCGTYADRQILDLKTKEKKHKAH